MPVGTKKFTALPDGNEMQVGDQAIGIRAGADFRFDFPGDGFKDANAKYLLKYVGVGAAAVNYPEITNSITGEGPIYGVDGTDTDVDWKAQPKGDGLFDFDAATAIQTPDGTTAQRPAATTAGRVRWNSDLSEMEYSDGSTWQQFASVTGSIPSIGSSTDNAVVRWNGTGGNAIQDSSVIVDDSDNVTGVNTLVVGGSTLATNTVATFVSGNSAIAVTSSLTDATSKSANYCAAHYTNAEEPFQIVHGTSSSGSNVAGIGGGGASYNAATRISFYTAANSTTLTGTERARVDSSGDWYFGTTTKATNTGFIIQSTNGMLALTDGMSNSVQKSARYTVPHYTNSEQPVVGLNIVSDGTDNFVEVGGGTATSNAATNIQFFTASNDTTTTGTSRGEIDSAGKWFFNTSTEITNSDYAFSGANGFIAATSTDTDSTNKNGSFVVNHYTNSEEPVAALRVNTTTSDNFVDVGGGTSAANAATRLRFMTAANNTTTTGTEQGRIDSAGKFYYGTTTAVTNSDVVFSKTNGMVALTTNMNDATSKQGQLITPHYTNAEEPFLMVRGNSTTSDNLLEIGGGVSTSNAATRTRIFAAANNTTTTGTEIIRYTTDGWSMDGGTDFYSGYNKGTWTPTITSDTPGDLSVAYGARAGTWREEDDVITLDCRVVFTPTYTTATGNMSIQGIPFAILGTTYFAGAISYATNNLVYTGSRTWASVRVNPGASNLQLICHQDSTTSVVEQITSITSGNQVDLRFSITYIRS